MKAFFEEPPEHDLKVGDLVTCSCHDSMAIIVQLYEKYTSNVWMHTIARLRKYKIAKAV